MKHPGAAEAVGFELGHLGSSPIIVTYCLVIIVLLLSCYCLVIDLLSSYHFIPLNLRFLIIKMREGELDHPYGLSLFEPDFTFRLLISNKVNVIIRPGD